MAEQPDPFVGRWRLNPAKSNFDPNHRPTDATMTFELDPDGGVYLMRAEGTSAKGDKVAERPQRIVVDGQPHPVPEMYGLSGVAVRPDPRTIRAEVRREDGSIAGAGTYAVSADGLSLTATTSGYDTQLREFRQQTVWDRQ